MIFPNVRQVTTAAPASTRITALETGFILLMLVGLFNPAILDILIGRLPRPDLAPLLGAEDQARYAAAGAGSSRISLLFWPTAYIISGMLFLRDAMRFSVLRASAAILLFCALLVASTFWSDAPRETAMRAAHFTGKSIFAAWLVSRIGLRRSFEMMVIAGTVVLLAGWLLALGKPSVGWQAYRGETALRGFFTHKTGYGMTAMFVTLITVGLRLSRSAVAPGRSLPLTGIFLFGAASLAMAQSVTAILVLLAGVFVILVARRVATGRTPALRRMRLVQTVALCAVAIVAIWLSYETILEFFGRDPTLSRRTDIWQSIVSAQQGGSLLGQGYYAFWRYVPGSALFEIVQRQGFAASSPHNAYLLAWIDVGWIGLAAFAGISLTGLSRATGLLVDRAGREAPMAIALVLVTIVIGTVESNLFTGQEINWIVLAIVLIGAGHENLLQSEKMKYPR